MKIKRIYIKSFGGISDKEYILSDSLNVIFGNNESGKSTFLSFIRFIFYGAKKQRGKELSFRDKYTPWTGEDLSGEVVFTLNGSEYSLSRTVSASGRKSTVALFNKSTGEQVPTASDETGCELFGMSEQAFMKTMFIASEGTKIESDGEILSKISNISQSGDDSTSYQFIKKQLDEMIADLSAQRRSKAVIPCLEREIEELTEKREQLILLCEKHDGHLAELDRISKDLDKALAEKTALDKAKADVCMQKDFGAYKKSGENLEKAGADVMQASQLQEDDDKRFDIIKNISPEEQEAIVKDSSAEKAACQMQAVLLKDKAASSKKYGILFSVGSLIFAVCIFFNVLFAAATVISLILAVYFFISGKKFKEQISDIEQSLEQLDYEKNEILKKYNLESSEHFLQLKRELSETNTKNEILKSKAELANRVYEERKAEFDAVRKAFTEKYGDPDSIEFTPVYESEELISERISSAEQDILRLTADKARLSSLTASTEGAGAQISELDARISDLYAKKAEADEKLKILTLADEILNKSYEEIKENFAPRLAKTTSDIFNRLTGGKYGELIVNDRFEIQIKKDGSYKNSNYFSSGTIQQLYFSLRLGIIELLTGDFPLFIDDAFITYDDERFAYGADFLRNYAEHNQIIFTTCHNRESNMNGAHLSRI